MTDKTTNLRALPKKCPPSAFNFAGQDYEGIDVTVPVDHVMEDFLRPDYWSSVAHLLSANAMTGRRDRRGSIITLRKQDHSMVAQFYVRAVFEEGVEVAPINLTGGVCYFGAQDDKPVGGFETRWNVGARGFDIIRINDHKIVGHAKDFQTKDAALAWIAKMKAA